jgi:hypothetical protein
VASLVRSIKNLIVENEEVEGETSWILYVQVSIGRAYVGFGIGVGIDLLPQPYVRLLPVR